MVIHPFQLKLLEPVVIVTVSISIRKPLSGQIRYSLLAIRMEVNSIDQAMHLIKANVIESFETGTVDFTHTVVRD